MVQFILLFSLILPAFGAGKRTPGAEEERAALLLLQTKFQRFSATVDEVDAKFIKLRLAAEQRNYAVAGEIAADLSRVIGVSKRQWSAVETWYTDSQKIRMNFHRPQWFKQMDLNSDFMAYLRFRRNNRYGTGIPLVLQMAAWRGLETGTKREAPPSNLRRMGEIGGLRVRANDSLLIILTNGGLVRGRLEGFTDGRLVLREVLPNTLGIIQRNEGSYRELDLTEAARVEVIRKPPTMSPQDSPMPVVGSDGGYSQYYVAEGYAFRVDLKPDNMELLKLAKDQRLEEAAYKAKVSPIDPADEVHPAYAELYFTDCEDFLKR